MRRRWGRQQKDDTETALANFALTFAKALLVFCVIMFVMISENKKTEDGIKPKVEAMISVSWNKDAKIDVDTWMRNSEGGIIYYMNKENGVLFLDRDDLGDQCISVCEEITSIRGLVEGEYVLNLNVFHAHKLGKEGGKEAAGNPLPEPLTVHVKIVQMNPTIVVVYEKDVVLTLIKEEKHVVRFNIHDGKLTEESDSKCPGCV